MIDNGEKLGIIAGPCSAESREMLIALAQSLSQISGVQMFRAGLWKPRSRPNGFEGSGQEGISWMLDARNISGLPICTEVTNPKQTELCLNAGFDAIWIGARTTTNPLLVDAIARSANGTESIVLVKNPTSPDLALWIGAIERFYNAGIKKIIAVHRGFRSIDISNYRNAPLWEIPIQLRQHFPNIPIYTDPSHMAGKRSLLPSICQKAMDLETNGFMIEVHPNPDNALTDALQQITPLQLQDLLTNLNFKQVGCNRMESLESMRTEIDDLDDRLLRIIAERMEIIKRMGHFKKEQNLTILQFDRWKAVLEMRKDKAMHLGISVPFIEAILQLMHEESIRIQQSLMDSNND